MDTGLCGAGRYDSENASVDRTQQTAGKKTQSSNNRPTQMCSCFIQLRNTKTLRVTVTSTFFQTNGFYRYIDGWHMNFANWNINEPRQDRPCVYMDVDGKWKTAFCNESMSSVCIQSTGTAVKMRQTQVSQVKKAIGLCFYETETWSNTGHVI